MEECLTCINCKGQKFEVYIDRCKCCQCGHEVKFYILINYEEKEKLQ